MSSLIPILVLSCIVIIFGGLALFLTSRVGPKVKSSLAKAMPYECGIQGQEKGNSKMPIKYYLIAILFILFDIEIIFMFPWALVYKDALATVGAFIFIEMMVFMSILIFGLFYIWKAGALEWE